MLSPRTQFSSSDNKRLSIPPLLQKSITFQRVVALSEFYLYSLLIYSMHQKNKQGENIFFSSKMDLSLGLNPGVDNDSCQSLVSLKSKLQCEDLDARSLFIN